MSAINPTDFLKLYHATSEQLLYVQLPDSQDSSVHDCLISLNHSCLKLTRCGVALGLHTIRPGADISELPKGHRLQNGIISEDEMSDFASGLKYMRRRLEECLNRQDIEGTDHVNGTDKFRGLRDHSISEQDARLATGLMSVARSRLARHVRSKSKAFGVLKSASSSIKLAADIAMAVLKIEETFVNLDGYLRDLAVEEIKQLRSYSLCEEDLVRLFSTQGGDDGYLKSAQEVMPIAGPATDADGKVCAPRDDSDRSR